MSEYSNEDMIMDAFYMAAVAFGFAAMPLSFSPGLSAGSLAAACFIWGLFAARRFA